MDIKVLEKRYQRLYSDFQAGKIDEKAFVSEVDKLQFQDSYGRYWMLGARTGKWHYYDGQTWHQADPTEADKLPFMDEHGRYWQRGVKSGDWYYYEPETEEWVKPGQADDPTPPLYYGERQRLGQDSIASPYQSRLQPQSADAGPGMPSQLDGELFQDDEGRYWAVGAKTGQWYFFDQNGWHPAHEFQATIGAQFPQPQPYYPPAPLPTTPYTSKPYSPQEPQRLVYQQPLSAPQPTESFGTMPPAGQPAAGYVLQPQQPAYTQGESLPPQQFQNYVTSPGQEVQPAAGQQPVEAQPTPSQPISRGGEEAETETPTKPASSEPDLVNLPRPPKSRSKSGSWYYFDGDQWLKYSSDKPEEMPPLAPKMVIDQEAKPTQVEAKSKTESVEAELFEDDEAPAEVVDVEVITVLEAEPEPKPKAEINLPSEPPRESRPSFSSESENVRPRRSSRPVATPRPRPRPTEPQPRPREATPVGASRPVAPRKKETAHEPTIIIPTGSTASKISAPASTPSQASKPAGPGLGERRRRAREDTAPISPIQSRESSSIVSAGSRHRQVTQALPPVSSTGAHADTAQFKVTTSAGQSAQQKPAPMPALEGQSPKGEARAKKAGFTLGDVLRSLPSTVWTFAGGVVLLMVCAFGLIFAGSWLQDGGSNSGSLVAGQIPTPTLDAGPPDASPTPGPTPTAVLEPEATVPASVSFDTFSSPTLGFTVEYPEDWQQNEEALWAIFSPSADGLDPENLKDSAIWIGIPADESPVISELLTGVLSNFPPDAETLNEGTISIASQTWTSAQIRYGDENLGGQGIATLAVTSKDDVGYYLVAVAPAEQWNSVQPLFQEMINSFRFASKALAQATPQNTEEEADTSDEGEMPGSSDNGEQSGVTATTEVIATPLTYIVKAGDTLLGIAIEFDVDVDLLASENNIKSPESLQVGQELTIPFTAEELAAYNASGGKAPQTEDSITDGEPDIPGAGEATTTEEASISVEAPSEEPVPPAEAASVSGRIAYPAFNPGTNNFDIWVADLATGEQTVIADQASQPAFNRDGSLLAYRSWSLDSRGVVFRDFIGGRGGQVTRFVEDGLPTWSPDGFSFAFASRREGDRLPRIYIGNQLGEGSFAIGFLGEYPSTFPDGRLAVKGCLPTGDCGIYVMGASGGGETKISGDGDTAPAVSPDGSKIAFMSAGRGATNWEIWVMNADGSNAQRLTENGSNEGLPAWSPDGRSIAYVSDQGGVWAVWVMNADGSNQRKLFNMMGSPDGYLIYDKDNSRGWLEERISWAP